jgi:hypothetical protein
MATKANATFTVICENYFAPKMLKLFENIVRFTLVLFINFR